MYAHVMLDDAKENYVLDASRYYSYSSACYADLKITYADEPPKMYDVVNSVLD